MMIFCAVLFFLMWKPISRVDVLSREVSRTIRFFLSVFGATLLLLAAGCAKTESADPASAPPGNPLWSCSRGGGTDNLGSGDSGGHSGGNDPSSGSEGYSGGDNGSGGHSGSGGDGGSGGHSGGDGGGFP